MPPRNPASSAAASTLAAPVSSAPIAQPAATPAAPLPVAAVASPQAAYPARRTALPPAAVGLPPAPPSADGDDEGGFQELGDLEAGDYIFLAYVDDVLVWPRGAGVTFKCICAVNKDTGEMSRAGVYGRELK